MQRICSILALIAILCPVATPVWASATTMPYGSRCPPLPLCLARPNSKRILLRLSSASPVFLLTLIAVLPQSRRKGRSRHRLPQCPGALKHSGLSGFHVRQVLLLHALTGDK